MVTIKPKQPSSNTLQKKATSINKKPIIPVEGIVTKRIMEYDEYEEVEGTEYLVVQGEKVPKRISVDNLFGYDNDVSKIVVDGIEYEPNEEGIIDISDVRKGLATEEHEHGNYALADHIHDQYLTEHQDLSAYATKDMLAASDARCESLIESHEHEEYALKDHEHEQYLTEHQSLDHLATKDMVRALDARQEDLLNTHKHDEYAYVDHRHDDDYAKVYHDHGDIYAPYLHEHDSYAPDYHEHDEYALKEHTHPYTPIGHIHEKHALVNHTHCLYLTEHQSLDHLVTKEEFNNKINELNNKIENLQNIVNNIPEMYFNEDGNLVVKIDGKEDIFEPLCPKD